MIGKPKEPVTEQAFWVDARDSRGAAPDLSQRLVYGTAALIEVLTLCIMLSILGRIVAAIVPAPWSWTLIGLFVLLMAAFYSSALRRLRRAPNAAAIQERAQSLTGASQMGSALHVAGHPLLSRDQPVVLGLSGNTLSIYSYDSAVPIDALRVDALQAVQTVVYDADRVPHLDVIDSAAQALQLRFQRDGRTWTCLFRQMRKLRPIDWYHILQQARWPASPAGSPPVRS